MKPVDHSTLAGADDIGPQSVHRRAWDLIPWVVAGSASGDEQALVHTHAQHCAECRDEIEFHAALRAGMVPAAAAVDDDAEAAEATSRDSWLRLRGRMVDELPDVDQPQPSVTAGGGGSGAPGRTASNLARWLVAAVVVQAVGLTVLGAAMVERSQAPDAYQTLSEPPVAAAALAAGAIRWVPAAGLTLAEVQAVLTSLGWQLADAAGDGTQFVLAPKPGQPQTQAQALAVLRAHPGTRLAEPMPAGH
jgi:hypothetical protein